MSSSANSPAAHEAGKGLALPGLIVGLLTGFAVYGINEYWIDGRDDNPLAVTALLFTITAAAAYLLLAERAVILKAAGGAFLIAAALAPPDYFMATAFGNETDNLAEFPTLFWFLTSRGLASYLMVTLVKASLSSRIPPSYGQVFFHGVTMPLIAGGAVLSTSLAVVLLFTWALLLKDLDVNFFNDLFQEQWFLLPFAGAIGGLSIALMRGLQSVLGALRFVLLFLCRILIVITALFTITLLLVFALKGVAPVFDRPYPSAWMMALALAGMLIFNGVYQNGEGDPPPLWLRLPTLITLIGFPIYTLIALYAFWLRVGEYGLTPPRIAGLAVNGLIAAYSVVCIAGLITELNWRAKRWMPFVSPLNTMMAALWVIVLIALATPLVNPWAISAKSQYARVAGERVAIEEFDFGYMRFRLGTYGDEALEKMLSLNAHPEIEAIRDGVKRARSAKNYWEYQNPDAANGVASDRTRDEERNRASDDNER